jgi:hypothetical protein
VLYHCVSEPVLALVVLNFDLKVGIPDSVGGGITAAARCEKAIPCE